MPVLTRLVPSPLFVEIRPGALDALGGILADQRLSASGRIAVAISNGSGSAMRRRLEPALPGADWYNVDDGSLDSAVRLAEAMRGGHYDAMVGLGGGKIIDAAKYAAARVGLPLVAVATNLAHDGICSPVSTLDNDAGRGSYGVPSPIGIVVDLDVIRQAPQRFVAAGVGDVVSNISACADWELSHAVTGEPVDGLAVAMARSAGENLLRHPGSTQDQDLLTALAEALVLSGIAMNIAGSTRPSSGACHEISHALDVLYPKRSAQHGEQVGLGAAFASFLRGERELTGLIVERLASHGLPVTAAQIGFTEAEFTEAVHYAPNTRPGRFTILEHLDLSPSAIRDAYADYVQAVNS
ncbi:iron-containing alcohol dehydrogenase family protein [Kitasatospora xanthocidica]|uniref:Iron-containing alcohol dehydrogenase family protein n=1 Tax=Kitasatospora xanthocidica TaxID=83382 RepID=A0A372ZLT4_9ACTN|nr:MULTISPECIES: iron-containing alcohol dehydrogenase family protein [Streptomycetaceae]OKI03860.1 dehydrogenase [Streptomyces sp. CB02056]RGD56195.1 iron-containing alcohol dehydrogenase family protein [Kitasatospora xanthocidica]BFD94668.1 iron-containing alcohol dehydrogenase family protein [Kitasatospora sp. Xyl93]